MQFVVRILKVPVCSVRRSWSRKKETHWETRVENMVAELMELGIAGIRLTKHGPVRGAWS